MKAEIVVQEKKFEPIEVKLVFETMKEVVDFISFVKDPECFSDTVARELDILANHLRDKINSIPRKAPQPQPQSPPNKS